MLFGALLIAHIAVLGYWLGSELVINSTYRYVSWSADMPFAERDRLMAHVMDVDQHVRYALILQAGLGTALAALLGYLPGSTALAVGAGIAAAAWLTLTEITHRRRTSSSGRSLARIDHAIRYVAIVGLLVLCAAAFAGYVAMPSWLTWKLLLFAGVIACGVGIRWQLIGFFVIWRFIADTGPNPGLERDIRRTYVKATSILGMLWLLIAGIVVLSIVNP